MTLREVINKVDNGVHAPYKFYDVPQLKDLLQNSEFINISKSIVSTGEYVDLIWQDIFCNYSENDVNLYFCKSGCYYTYDENEVLTTEESEKFLIKLVITIQETYDKYAVLIKNKIKDDDLDATISTTTSNKQRNTTTSGVIPQDKKFEDDGSADNFTDKQIVIEQKRAKDFAKLAFLYKSADILKNWRLRYFEKYFISKKDGSFMT